MSLLSDTRTTDARTGMIASNKGIRKDSRCAFSKKKNVNKKSITSHLTYNVYMVP